MATANTDTMRLVNQILKDGSAYREIEARLNGLSEEHTTKLLAVLRKKNPPILSTGTVGRVER